jgi:hypothetical protein
MENQDMKKSPFIYGFFLLGPLLVVSYSPRLVAQTDRSAAASQQRATTLPIHGRARQNSSAPATNAAPTAAERHGQHDFDPLIGSWKVHWKRRLHPLTGSTTWIEFDGTDVYRKIWAGRANLDEIEAEGPTGHIEGLTLRLYNPQTHQWSLYWANSKDGKVAPPNVGEFKDGRGEFYTQDTLDGRLCFNRYIWSKLTTNSPHFEESWSDDGGKTWEVDGIADMTRINENSVKPYVVP